MSVISTAIRFMKSGGMSAEQIVEAILAMEAEAESLRSPYEAGDPVAERRRAFDRERKRAERDARMASSAESPVESGGKSADIQLSLSSLSKEVSKKERKEIARGRTIPPDWKPSERHIALGASLGHSRGRVDEIADEMRDWGAANRNRAVGRKADWDKTFNGFLRRAKVVKSSTGPPPLTEVPYHGKTQDGRIWFHMDSREFQERGGGYTDRYCGRWFPTEAA